MSDSTFGFIGLGLIGGSIARGLRRANKDITIMAYRRKGPLISFLTGSTKHSLHVT